MLRLVGTQWTALGLIHVQVFIRDPVFLNSALTHHSEACILLVGEVDAMMIVEVDIGQSVLMSFWELVALKLNIDAVELLLGSHGLRLLRVAHDPLACAELVFQLLE